jgi:hypothetical protein
MTRAAVTGSAASPQLRRKMLELASARRLRPAL